jgi:hypothetical protein
MTGFLLFTTASRLALGSSRPPIQWVTSVLPRGIKRPGLEADHSPPLTAEVKNAWCLVKQRDNFTFYLYLYMLIKVKHKYSCPGSCYNLFPQYPLALYNAVTMTVLLLLLLLSSSSSSSSFGGFEALSATWIEIFIPETETLCQPHGKFIDAIKTSIWLKKHSHLA